jgi:hypothetical protein
MIFTVIAGVTVVSIVFYIYAACKSRELAMQVKTV